MKGKHRVVVQNNRLHYEFEIKRNKYYIVFTGIFRVAYYEIRSHCWKRNSDDIRKS